MSTKRKTVKKSTKSSKAPLKQHPKHFLKVYWPYIPVIAMVVAGMLFGGVNPATRSSQPATLAYSTEMSITGLLSSTNSQRSNNGLSNLKVNSKLNASAQAKANNMVADDYWSHNTPDGEEPWVFFDAAGYSYQKAGENLAYGFSTSNATVIGWMNSPSHRANILDSSYTEVGFGFTNSSNFIGTGPETIVVAHYAKPLKQSESSNTPAPVTKAPKIESKPATQSATDQPENEKQKVDPKVTKNEDKKENEEPLPDNRFNQPINSDNPIPSDLAPTNITRLQDITGGRAPWSALVLSVVAFSIVILWLIKHAVLVKRYVLAGEHFVAHHPLLDLLVVFVAAIAVYLSQSSGVVL